MTVQADRLRAVIDAAKGGRVVSLSVDGLELLAPRTHDDEWLLWGMYPMVPWAGRVRFGRFPFDGVEHQLDIDLYPHACHGLGHTAPWTRAATDELRLDLDGAWPFGGMVSQTFRAEGADIVLTMTAQATRRMPVMLGWHPCFRRQLDLGEPVQLEFAPEFLWERDDVGIPTGRTEPPPPGPWDDCFGGVVEAPVLEWPGVGSVSIEARLTDPAGSSVVDTWVVYDEQPEIVCVEPQSQAPDAFNRDPLVVEAAESLTMEMRLTWKDHRP